MQSQLINTKPQVQPNQQGDCLSWGAVELQVTDLDRAVQFWTSVLALRQRVHDGAGVALGTSEQTLFVLHPGAKQVMNPRHLGMYHVALGVPSQLEFSRLMRRLLERKIPISIVDHLMSKAIYLHDPDGLGIEIAFETPERFAHFGDKSRDFTMFDSNGQSHNGREPLEMESELAHAQGSDVNAELSSDAFVAHLHLQVNALDTAAQWFEKLGFSRNLFLPKMGFCDLAAGAAYTHRLAVNTWAGSNLSPAPTDMARLLSYHLNIDDANVLANTRRLKSVEKGLQLLDPAGVTAVLKFST